MAHQEAMAILGDVVRDLASGKSDIKVAMRQCQLACELIGWQDRTEWFRRELGGYPEGAPIPPYRTVTGSLRWKRRTTNLQEIIRDEAEQSVYSSAPWDREVESTSMDIRWGIDAVMTAATKGHRVKTGETREDLGRSGKEYVELERVKQFSEAGFQAVIDRVEGLTFDFATQSYASLRYGDSLTDIWSEYRAQVDPKVQELHLGHHLDAIHDGLRSDNPEAWRNAVYGCRNLFHDLSNHLWRDKRKTYDHLPGGGAGGKLEVSADKSKNRISAYLHQKGFTGSRGKFMRAEIERLAESFSSLLELQSTAHAQVQKEDARSIAIATYVVLGELVLRTDMQPVEEYGEPAAK